MEELISCFKCYNWEEEKKEEKGNRQRKLLPQVAGTKNTASKISSLAF